MKALVVVDVQNDFVSGSLAVPDAEAIIPVIEKMAWDHDGGALIATRDWHPEDHCSFVAEPEYRDGSWPTHCVQFTPGAAFAWKHPGYVTEVVSKGQEQDAEAYSGFDGTTLTETLRGHGVEQVDVVGLALDYCVKATALDAQAAGFETTVLLEGTRAVAPDTGEQAIAELEAAGVTVR